MIIKLDGGSKFKGLFKDICEKLRIKHHTTIPYHPQFNEIAKRFVRTIKTYLLRYLIMNDPIQWEIMLPQIQFAINTTIATPHKYLPFQLQFGTNVDTSLDMTRETLILKEDINEQRFFDHVNAHLR